MPARSPLRQTNRNLLRRINRILLKRARGIFSLRLRGHRFRAAVRAEEAVEVAGLSAYDLEEPFAHIDFSRLSIDPTHLPFALVNEQVLARRFERRVENEFFVVLDLSRSMRFPHRRVYADEESSSLIASHFWGKPSLLKVICGAFVNVAAESGFTVRVVTFGQNRPDYGQPMRRRPDLMSDLFARIDQRFLEVTRNPGREECGYEEVILRLSRRPGVFLFASDFLDGAFDWGSPAKRRRWLHTLGLLREWGRRSPLLVARINHHQEVKPPPSPRTGQEDNPWGDRCDVQVEQNGKAEDAAAKAREANEKCRLRLRNQQAWSAVLNPVLRSCCRGYLAVHNRDCGPRLSRELRRMWSRLTER